MSARRFSDMAAEVVRATKRPPEEPVQVEATPYGRCPAHGCPVPAGINESTTGGGVWMCRFHFGAAAAQWPEITRTLRQRKTAGVPLDEIRPSATVEAMRLDLRSAAGIRSREPGEDDE